VFVDPVPVFLGVKEPDDDNFITPVVVLLNVNRGERLRNESRIDAGAWTAYSMPFVVSGRGPHSVGFRTLDSVGNLLAEASRTLIIGR
jgi:hypothetical protein